VLLPYAVACCAILPLQPVVLESATDQPGYTSITGNLAAVMGGINAAAVKANFAVLLPCAVCCAVLCC
jgi:hypothetical protein